MARKQKKKTATETTDTTRETASGPPAGRPAARHVAVPMDQIAVEHRARQPVDSTAPALIDLAASIEQLGMIEPVVLLERSGDYRLLAGERRLKAAKIAGEKHVEAMVYPRGSLDARQQADIELAENFQREDFNHVEIARALASSAEAGRTVRQIADQTHKSLDWVREHLDLLRLDEKILELVATGRIPIKQGAMISRVGDKKGQVDLARAVMGGCWGPAESTPLAKVAAESDTVETMKDLRKHVQWHLKALGGAHWPMDEPYATKWACSGCPDNTATEAGLFEGINMPGKSKKGNCTNRACYDAKVRAWEKDPVKKKRDADREEKRQEQRAKPQAGAGGDADRGPAGGTPAASKTLDPFPVTAKDRLGLAMLEYGRKLRTGILKRLADGPVEDAAVAICLRVAGCQGWIEIDTHVRGLDAIHVAIEALTSELQSGSSVAMDLTGDVAALLDVTLDGYEGDWKPQHLDDIADNAGLAELALMEALAARWEVNVGAERPRAESVEAERIVEAICNGKRDAAAAAVAEVSDPAVLKRAEAAGITAKWRQKMVNARHHEISGLDKARMPASMQTVPTERLCDVLHGGQTKHAEAVAFTAEDVEALGAICKAKRTEAIVAIDECEKTFVLRASEEKGLKGDWRRAAVARRIMELETAV